MSGCSSESRAISDPSFSPEAMFFLILDYLPHQPIQPGEFLDGIFFVCFRVEKMFVSVKDHAELRAPIADVIVAYHLVAQETQRAAQGVADDRRADVAHVHGLGHVGGGKVDHVSPRAFDGLDAQSIDVSHNRASVAGRATRLSGED